MSETCGSSTTNSKILTLGKWCHDFVRVDMTIAAILSELKTFCPVPEGSSGKKSWRTVVLHIMLGSGGESKTTTKLGTRR